MLYPKEIFEITDRKIKNTASRFSTKHVSFVCYVVLYETTIAISVDEQNKQSFVWKVSSRHKTLCSMFVPFREVDLDFEFWLCCFLFQFETKASLSRENISLYLCCYFKTFCLENFFSKWSGYNFQNMIGSNQKIDGLFRMLKSEKHTVNVFGINLLIYQSN